jgi:hypothetical protein
MKNENFFYENAAIKTKNLLQHCIEGKKKNNFPFSVSSKYEQFVA